jgi:hypothetical protein
MRRIPRYLALLVLALSVALPLSGVGVASRGAARVQADQHQQYYCEESTHVTVASRTVSTPIVCVPFP